MTTEYYLIKVYGTKYAAIKENKPFHTSNFIDLLEVAKKEHKCLGDNNYLFYMTISSGFVTLHNFDELELH